MKIRLLLAAILALSISLPAIAQTQVDLGNGFKPWGSYDGSSLDSVGLENGNLILHAPLIPKYPQRGSLGPEITLYVSSNNWEAACLSEDPLSGTPTECSWAHGGTGIWFKLVGGGLSVQRTVERTSDPLGGFDYFVGGGYVLTTWDGSSHQLYDLSGGNLSSFVTMDGTGYQVTVSNPDQYGVPQDVAITDRNGEQRSGTFGGARCSDPQWFAPRPAGNYARVYDQWQSSPTVCVEHSLLQKFVDRNGNTISFQAPLISAAPPIDTAGRPSWPLQGGTLGDSSNCINTLPFADSVLYSYPGANGAQNQIKVCRGTPTLQTFFNLGGTTEYQNTTAGSQTQAPIITSIILADGTYWSFSYDNYGNVASIHLPTGGTITYGWTTLYPGITTPCAMAYSGLPIPAARVVSQRTLVDNNGHSLTWNYHWGGLAADRTMTNWVTDPNGNDTVHVFKAVASSQCYYGGGSPGFHETQTKYFQGTKDSGTLLKQVDTSYGRATMKTGNNGLSFEADAFPTDIQTTVYPSGKVSLVHKDYDYAFGANVPSAGAVTAEKVYDWGNGAAGPLLRETDTTYQWHVNAAYLSAGMLDLPATVIVKDGSGNRVAETDYSYDEPGYLQPYTGTLPSGTHGAAPSTVRGNQTTSNRWLNTSNTFVPSHVTWYDTGEVYQSSDPLGHTTTYSYDPQFGTYRTQTCSPPTAGGAVTHCVSGSYDSTIGLLASFTDQNQQTTNYSYDSLTSRITSALAPPDPANSNIRALTQFIYSQPNVFPITAQVVKPVTSALSDSSTTTFDGLGRVYETQHTMPTGPPATVVTTHDETHAQLIVTNPYFTTSDSTYGLTTDFFDALGRTTQITEQDGSVRTAHFSVVSGVYDLLPGTTTLGDCNDSIDEAGKQRRSCTDALGRLVEVDEQNPGAGIVAATGSVSISGSEQSATSQPAIAASINITIGGSNSSNTFVSCTPTCRSGSLPDTGQIGFGVNVGGTTVGSSVSYNNTYNPATLAAALYQNFPANAWVTMSNPNGTSSFTLTATSAGTAQDSYVLTAMVTTSCMDTDTMSCAGPGWTMTLSGPALASTTASPQNFSGGQNASTTPDSGTVTVTVDGTAYQTSYGASDDAGQIATRLAGLISAGSWASASASGGTITLTSKTSGGSGNYSLAASYTYNSSVFVHPSFTTGVSGSRLSGGYGASDLDNHPFKTLYFYDALGNLLCVEQHGNVTGTGCSASPASDASSPWRVRRFTYDSLSRLLTAHNPESGAISYSYDADGNLLQKTSPAPNQPAGSTLTQTISYCYDELHRVTGKAWSAQSCPLASPVVTYTYDAGTNAKGKLTHVTDQAGTADYTYDPLGRIVTETRVIAGISKSISYDYNLDGSLKTLHYPSGAATTYAPDSAGRILSALDSGNNINYVTSATYQADGQMTGFVSGNGGAFSGITSAFTYNKRLQPINMSANAPSQTVFSIGYDFHVGNGTSGADNGNVWGITNYKDQSRNQTFTYDALNRLTSAQNAGTNCAASTVNGKTEYWGNSYGYDPWGNLTGKTITKCGAELLNAPALVNNQLSGYGYDAAGNMTSDPTDNVTAGYDAENRIASASTASGAFTYTYDADGNRVEKSGGGSGTLYWYMTPGIVAESDLAGNLKSEYVFFNGERVARRDFDPSTHAPTGVFYYFSDHLKTASVITDSAGNIKSESDYYPWGGELQFVNNDSNHYKFTGKERDSESGLDYFGARYYSNGLGRFITPDWAAKAVDVPYAEFSDPQSLNLYGYVRDLPTSRADMDGHQGPNGQNDFGPMCNFCMDGPMWLLNQILPGNAISAAYFQNSQNKTPPPPPPATPSNASQSAQSTPADPNKKKPQEESNQKETKSQSEDTQTVRRVTNPKHHPNSASPEPSNAQQLFDHSIEDKNGVRWAKDSDGTIHRFSKPSNGESHWNGSTKGSNGIRVEDIPIEIRKALK